MVKIVGDSKPNNLLTVNIENINITIDPDTGSDVDIINEREFMKIIKENPETQWKISMSKSKITTLGGHPLAIVGCIKNASIANQNAQTTSTIYVMRDGIYDYPLLSEKTLLNLGMIKYSEAGEFAKQETSNEEAVKVVHIESESLNDLLSKHKELFNGIGKLCDPKTKEAILTDIHIKDTAIPQMQPPRDIPYHLRDKVKKKIDYFVDQGIMSWTKPSEPILYCSPLVITQKGLDDVRITADFRLANKNASRTRIVPGVRIDELQVIFKGCTIFSKIDLNNGYHQFYVSDKSKQILTVTTPWGNLTHNTLAQGFISSQDEFDRHMVAILGDIPHVKTNRDDCLIGGLNLEDHNRNLDTVLTRIGAHNLTLNKEKSEFGKQEIEFYGIILNSDGIKPSRQKIQALHQCKAPTSKDGVKSFLQMAGYMSRFIPHFSTLSAPLRNLTKKNKQFRWTEEENTAFEKIRNSLTAESALSYFEVNKPIHIYVDAAKKTSANSDAPGGLCAILCQQDENNSWRMVHVANRALKDVETRYGQTELESLAIMSACKSFHNYVVGAPQFKIFTDCKPLVHLYNNAKSTAPPRIERHILEIQGLDYVVEYTKGSDNIADYLSRHILKTQGMVKLTSIHEDEIKNTYFSNNSKVNIELTNSAEADELYQKLIKTIENDRWRDEKKKKDLRRFHGVASNLSVINGMIFYKNLLVPPFKLQMKYVDIAHKLGHAGETRTFDLLKERIWFPGISKACIQKVKGCLLCQATHSRTFDEPLQSTEIPREPWHTIAVDFKGPLKDGRYALIGYDLHSRYPIVEYTTSTRFSKVKHIFNKWISSYGTPYKIKSDGGPPFNGEEFRKYADQKGFFHQKVKPYHPRGNGEAERFIQTLIKAITIAAMENTNYEEHIEARLNSYRGTTHPVTKRQPFELLFGRKMRIGELPNSPPSTTNNTSVITNDSKYKHKSKLYHDKRRNVKASTIKIGDKVYMKNKRTDNLSSEIGDITNVIGNSVTARFENGKVYTRDKSHFKIINYAVDTKRRAKECLQKEMTNGEHKPFLFCSNESESESGETIVPDSILSQSENESTPSMSTQNERPSRLRRKNPKYYNDDYDNS